MKKYLLSFLVVTGFVAYSIKTRLSPVDQTSSSLVLPSSNPIVTSSPSTPSTISTFKDGSYTGDLTDAFYGNIQVRAVIQSGRIADVQFLTYPSDRRTSIEINTQAMPLLKQEAIQSQSDQVDIVSGATQTSMAFIKSLDSALNQAKN